MLFALMIFCALAAVLFIAFDAYNDLHDIWRHPGHRDFDQNPHIPKSRSR
jgi:hypothetical protein